MTPGEADGDDARLRLSSRWVASAAAAGVVLVVLNFAIRLFPDHAESGLSEPPSGGEPRAIPSESGFGQGAPALISGDGWWLVRLGTGDSFDSARLITADDDTVAYTRTVGGGDPTLPVRPSITTGTTPVEGGRLVVWGTAPGHAATLRVRTDGGTIDTPAVAMVGTYRTGYAVELEVGASLEGVEALGPEGEPVWQEVRETCTFDPGTVAMPDVRDLGWRSAEVILGAADLGITPALDDAWVVAQHPLPGDPLGLTECVTLVLRG